MRYSITNATVSQILAAGGRNIKQPRHIPVVFAELTSTQTQQLQVLGATVTPVGKVRADVSPPTPVAAIPVYSAEQLIVAAGYEDLRSLTDPPLYGEGFNIAIIDTGIRESHEKISGRVVYRKNYTSDPIADTFNHGSAVAGVVITVAPKCGILNLKVLGDEGNGTEEEVTEAIDDCIDFQNTNPEIAPTVINLSLGALDDGDPNNVLRVACRVAIGNGVWIIASAGNSGPTPGTVTSPAVERYVGAVGSCKYEPFTISGFSSRGPTQEGLIKPDVVMFGENIVVASSTSDTATIAKSGTSFSTPFIAGMAICYHEGIYRQAVLTQPLSGLEPSITWLLPIEVMMDQYLLEICVKPEGVAPGKDSSYGAGLPFGSLIAQAVTIPPVGIDISSLISLVMVVGMMGIAVRSMK